MANKVITFTLGEEGVVTPTTEQKAGVQGSHNVTEVRFEVSKIDATENTEFRIQFIDGAGGFYSTGFLNVVTEGDKRYVSTMLPDDVTNAGGLAFAYLVVSEIVGETEDKVLMSDGGKLRFGFAGVGSPSEYAYRTRISNALVNAEAFKNAAATSATTASNARDAAETAQANAETARFQALQSAQEASDSASSASQSASDAAESLEDLENKIASGDFKGEPGPQGPQGIQGDKGDKGEPGETPDLTGYISMWQPNTEYKVGDVAIGILSEEWHLGNGLEVTQSHRTVIAKCIGEIDIDALHYFGDDSWEILQETYAYYDALGRGIHNTYATKDELAEAIGQALEGDY